MTDTDQNGKEEQAKAPEVYWSALFERNLNCHSVDALLDIAVVGAVRNHQRISVPYMRTDMARNRICQSFLEVSKNPNDVLVMLDGDHVHPHDIVARLTAHPVDLGVVGALYFRRGEPYDPLFFRRMGEQLRNPAEWEKGMVYRCDAVGTGAIAIRRWVFEKLNEQGMPYPWFQYVYPKKADFSMTEDIFFAGLCETAGISHYCDTSIITLHVGVKFIGERDWLQYVADHPEISVVEEEEELGGT